MSKPQWMLDLAAKKAARKAAEEAGAPVPSYQPNFPANTATPAAPTPAAPKPLAPVAAAEPAPKPAAPVAAAAPTPPPPAVEPPTAEAAKPPSPLKKRPSIVRMEMDIDIKPAWEAFMEAAEVGASVRAYEVLRRACKVAEAADGRAAFDAVKEATAVSQVSHKTKSLMVALAENWKLRPTVDSAARVVISGAGPVGLRAAVEAALMGQRVHVLEKRAEFSRVNILMLWQGTADDLVAYGARAFYPKFTNRNMGDAPLHLGTREIQLVLLKNALLLGVKFSYGTELLGVQAPPLDCSDGGWRAWAMPAASTTTHQTAGGVLDFKPQKDSEYTRGAGQGLCNLLQTSAVDGTFVHDASAALPAGALCHPFDALLLAEGEWSQTCKRLGFTKSVDKFSLAIGLVINMVRDPLEPRTKDPNMRSFTVKPFDEIGKRLTASGIGFEFAEYLKGETHYIVVTIKKSSLLKKGALREDLPSGSLLTKSNLDEPALMSLAREIATIIGLPETTQFTDFHPAKLFDFSSRARCVAPFRVLGVKSGGAQAGSIVACDLEAHPYLCTQEGNFMERQLEASLAALAKSEEEKKELEEAIAATTNHLAGLESALNEATDAMMGKVAAIAQAADEKEAREAAMRRRCSSGVRDDEWEDEDALPTSPAPTAADVAAQRSAEYGVARDVTDPEERQVEEARLEAYKRSLNELKTKMEVQGGFVESNRERQREWLEKVKASEGGMAHAAPVLPVGDSILEPFWPQGLGSNRGFHSALDAIWCVHVLHEEGLEDALLERNFWYDLMLMGPWAAGAGILKPAEKWVADPLSRYADGAIVRTKQNYTNPQSKRLFRGEGATPARILKMDLKGTKGFM